MSIDPTRTLATMPDNSPTADETRRMGAEEAGRQFESYLAQLMVKEMRKTIPEGMFGSRAIDIFSGVFDQEISQRISERGSLGLGTQLSAAIEARGLKHSAPESSPPPPTARGLLRQRRAVPPVDGRITSRFGRRADPFQGDSRHHAGMDIAAAKGTPVRAVRDGEVVMSGERGGFGRVVVVDHGDGMTTLYAHCDSLNVRAGQRVAAGQSIATVGDTGRATGPHLHFEARLDGESVDPSAVFGWRE